MNLGMYQSKLSNEISQENKKLNRNCKAGTVSVVDCRKF